MRPVQKYLSLFFLALLLSASLLFAPQSHAVYEPPSGKDFYDLLVKNKSLQDYGKEFCDKRSGDLMNLETWYSGKCGPNIDTLSGEGVGFSDIVVLQGIEALIGPQQKGFLDQLVDTIKLLADIKNLVGSNNGQTIDEKLALIRDMNPNTGLLSQATKITGNLLLARPASSIDYLAYVSSNLKERHIIDQAYAAGPGYGFKALSPVLPLWRAFRNIAYMLFALAFILYGVMIMFRIRIDGKTAASIQLAIPKLIATLLIITFSYAIVGFLVDLSTLVTSLAINLMAVGDHNILNLTWYKSVVSAASGTSRFGAIGSLFVNTIVALIISPFVLVSVWAGPTTQFFGLVLGIAGFRFGFGFIIGIILFLMILYSYFKLIIKLFQAFLSIIVSLIFAPLILLGNIFPGSTSFSGWLRSIYGNLAVFPVAVFFLTLSYALMVQPFFGTIPSLINWIPGVAAPLATLTSNVLGVRPLATTDGIWSPPMTFPFVGANGDMVLAAIGIGLLLMSSKYCEMVEKALKTPPFPYGAAIGEALKYGVNTHESWAKKGYAGAPSKVRDYLGSKYGGPDADTRPVLKGTNINAGELLGGKK